jgi:hypothetical protein
MGAIGIAIMTRDLGNEVEFNFDVSEIEFQTVGGECGGCPNNCEIICVLQEGKFLDGWGNRCPAGIERMRKRLTQ